MIWWKKIFRIKTCEIPTFEAQMIRELCLKLFFIEQKLNEYEKRMYEVGLNLVTHQEMIDKNIHNGQVYDTDSMCY